VHTFDSHFRAGEPEIRPRRPIDPEELQDEKAGSWISPWGVSAFCLATLALFAASIYGSRVLSISLAVLGLAAVGIGLVSTAKKRLPRDWIWFLVGGGVNVLTLSLIFFAAGLLNRIWEMDAPPPRSDPHLMEALPIDQPSPKGRPLAPEDRIDAASEAIKQNDLFFQIMEVRAGAVPERGEKSFLLIQCRIAGRGNEQAIAFEGFGKDKHQPNLTDEAGRSIAFLELRKRKLPAGGIVFLPAPAETAQIVSKRFLDYQLVFELPPGDFFPLQLDLPASAWGRQGVCRFRVTGFFEPIMPKAKQN
jgi:hypothetical protein